jgi:TorA maturation chaperone TorD
MTMENKVALNTQEAGQIARARAAFYSFLSVHFTALPDEAFVDRMRDGDLARMLKALTGDPTLEADIADGASLMTSFLEARGEDDPSQLAETLGVDRTRLFRGVSPAYGPPPPFEMVWSKTHQDITLLQVLAGFYGEMGLAPSKEIVERHDYAGVELDLMCELALREAQAWESGDPQSATDLLETQTGFMSQHLGEWLPAFIEEALKWVKTDFYKGHLLMLRGFIASEQRELAFLAGEAI